MKNAGCWNYFQKYLSGLVAFISLFSVIESAIACGAPPEVCEWKKKIVGLKTNNMVASGNFARWRSHHNKSARCGGPSICFGERLRR